MMRRSNWDRRGAREHFFCSTEGTFRLMFSRADRRRVTLFSAVLRPVLEGSFINCWRQADARLLAASKIQCAFLVAWFRSRLDDFWHGALILSERSRCLVTWVAGPAEVGRFEVSRRWTPFIIALTEEVGLQIWTSGVEENCWYWWREVQSLLGCVFVAGPSSTRVETKAEPTSAKMRGLAHWLPALIWLWRGEHYIGWQGVPSPEGGHLDPNRMKNYTTNNGTWR